MDDIRYYQELYRYLDGVSPLRFDCGRLCAKACCQVEPELPGMFLFPGEETLFAGKDGFAITSGILPGYGQVAMLSCTGVCPREHRPLSCRLFPLAPTVGAGGVSVRLDPRGRRVCPLCRGELKALSSGFIHAVQDVFAGMAAEARTTRFLTALSQHLDEFGRPL